MNTTRTLFLRFRNLFHKNELDRDLNDELACHLELHIEDNLRSGMTLEAARRDVLLSGSSQHSRDSMKLLGGCYRIPIRGSHG